MDITYIPMARGFVYLAAVVDWYSRRVLAWRVSISIETAFCIEAVEEALQRHGRLEIFNTDQGSQFTSTAFTDLLKQHGIAISMDGKGCWRDNVFTSALPQGQTQDDQVDSTAQALARISALLNEPEIIVHYRRLVAKMQGRPVGDAFFNEPL